MSTKLDSCREIYTLIGLVVGIFLGMAMGNILGREAIRESFRTGYLTVIDYKTTDGQTIKRVISTKDN